MDIRSNDDGQVSGGTGVLNAAPACGELIFGGGTAFASASNPTAEVLDGTGVTAGGLSLGVTESAIDGTLTILRTGHYDVELVLSDFSSGTASGNVQFDVQKNSAAFSETAGRMQAIRVAATAKAGLSLKKRKLLKKGDVIRAVVTSAAGAVQTVTEGRLSVKQIKDISTKTIVQE